MKRKTKMQVTDKMEVNTKLKLKREKGEEA